MSDEINKLIADYEEASEDVGRYGRDAADLERRAAARFALSDAIAALRAERDELAARLEAAEKAAGHSEFYSWPLTTTISRALTERDAAQAEAGRLREALAEVKRTVCGIYCCSASLQAAKIIRAALESKT